jgi:AcrR family transcriptional regulator
MVRWQILKGGNIGKQKETTKEKIMRVAAKIFSERGFDKVTAREIAKAVGINSASIYYYFSSKDDLLKSLYSFYRVHLFKVGPDINELLCLAEADPPHEVLLKSIIDRILKPLLRRMVELGKIKPFDVDAFLRMLSYYYFSVAALNNSTLQQSAADYQAGMSYFFSTITPE